MTLHGQHDLSDRRLVMNGQGQGRHPHLGQLSLYVLQQDVGLATP